MECDSAGIFKQVVMILAGGRGHGENNSLFSSLIGVVQCWNEEEQLWCWNDMISGRGTDCGGTA